MVYRCFVVDVINIINVALCVLILVAGCIAYIKTKIKAPFHIGVAFGLFAVSHVIAMFGVQVHFVATMTLIRIFAYLIVLFSLWEMRKKT